MHLTTPADLGMFIMQRYKSLPIQDDDHFLGGEEKGTLYFCMVWCHAWCGARHGSMPDGMGSLAAASASWAFDDAGRMTSNTDEQGTVISYSYDNLGRLTTLTLPDPDGAGAQTSPVESYKYNAAS